MSQDFKDRIARITARDAPKDRPHIAEDVPPPKNDKRLRLVIWNRATAGLGIVMLVLAASWLWETAFSFSDASEDTARMTVLERTLYDRMSDDQIARMQSDPDLKGKTIMQKMLLSH